MQLLKDKPLSIEELVKILPLSQEIKNEILSGYETWPEERRAATTEMLWDEFAKCRDDIRNIAYETLITTRYGDDSYNGDMNLWAQADDIMWKYIAELLAGKAEADQTIERLRSELKQIKMSK
jgi:ABC-type glycerol-3-phosphate transport system substrate-binding protein